MYLSMSSIITHIETRPSTRVCKWALNPNYYPLKSAFRTSTRPVKPLITAHIQIISTVVGLVLSFVVCWTPFQARILFTFARYHPTDRFCFLLTEGKLKKLDRWRRNNLTWSIERLRLTKLRIEPNHLRLPQSLLPQSHPTQGEICPA